VHERSHGSFLREVRGLFIGTPACPEQAPQTIERLDIGVVEFDREFWFEIPSLDGQGRLTPKPFPSLRCPPRSHAPCESHPDTRSGQVTSIRLNP